MAGFLHIYKYTLFPLSLKEWSKSFQIRSKNILFLGSVINFWIFDPFADPGHSAKLFCLKSFRYIDHFRGYGKDCILMLRK